MLLNLPFRCQKSSLVSVRCGRQIIRSGTGSRRCPHLAYQAVLTAIYIEALLVDEELADQVWEAWDAGEIDDQTVCMAWMLIAML